MDGKSNRRLINEIWIDKLVYWNQPVINSPTTVTKSYQFYLHQQAQINDWGWKNYITTYVAKNIVFKVGGYPIERQPGTTTSECSYYNWPVGSYITTNSDYIFPNLDYLVTPNYNIQADVSCRGFDGDTYQILWKNDAYFPQESPW